MDREAPKNLNAEMSVLGSMVIAPEAIEYAAATLQKDNFYDSRNATLFKAISDMHSIGVILDAVTLAEHLEANDLLARSGGPDYMFQIMDVVPHATHIRHYCDIVRKKSQHRQLIDLCGSTLEDAYAAGADPDELIGVLNSRLEKTMTGAGVQIRSIKQVLLDMEERELTDGAPIATGLPDLDDALGGGLRGPHIVFVGARPSMGKTSLGIQICEGAATKGIASLFVSIEMDPEEVTARLPERLREEIAELPIHFGEEGDLDLLCNEIRLAVRMEGVSIAVIDYFQLIQARGFTSTNERLTGIARRMKKLAKELRIPIVLLAQLSRKVEEQPGCVPQLGHIKGSGSAEEDGDVVLFIHRPSFYDPADRPGEADIIVAKQRNHMRGMTVKLGYEAHETRFVPYAQRTMRVEDYFREDHQQGTLL